MLTNKELREKQKQEALKRLEILEKLYGVHENVLREFKADETIYYSDKWYRRVYQWYAPLFQPQDGQRK